MSRDHIFISPSTSAANICGEGLIDNGCQGAPLMTAASPTSPPNQRALALRSSHGCKSPQSLIPRWRSVHGIGFSVSSRMSRLETRSRNWLRLSPASWRFSRVP